MPTPRRFLPLAMLILAAALPPSPCTPAMAAAAATAATNADEPELSALVGTWWFARDVTPDREPARRSPNHGSQFTIRLEDGVLVTEQPRPTTPSVTRAPLDSTEFSLTEQDTKATYRGRWRDGAWNVDVRIDAPGKGKREVTVSSFTFRPVATGLEISMQIREPIKVEGTCLYQKEEDLEQRDPVPAKIDDLKWLAGDWRGKQRTATIDERWCAAAGGAMLGTSRTVNGGRMVAFEFLRIVERGPRLIYFAQPGGRPPTEFVLVELEETRAVFENPLHDFPQRIAYERVDDQLTAEISYIDGGRPQRFDFSRSP